MMLKITPLNVRDKTPTFASYLRTIKAIYHTYGIRNVTTVANDEDSFTVIYKGIPVLKVEPAEHAEDDSVCYQ